MRPFITRINMGKGTAIFKADNHFMGVIVKDPAIDGKSQHFPLQGNITGFFLFISQLAIIDKHIADIFNVFFIPLVLGDVAGHPSPVPIISSLLEFNKLPAGSHAPGIFIHRS